MDRRRVRVSALIALAAGFATLVSPHAAPAADEQIPPPPEPALASITAADAIRHVNFLASAKLEGRGSGMPGADAAGKYLVEQLTSYGVEPAGPDGKWEQPFEVKLAPFPGQPPSDEAKGQPATTFNVCGVIRGTDEKLKDEYVLLSAHYDHVGKLGKKKIFYGADDNASGTAALLEVAQAFAMKPPTTGGGGAAPPSRPRRSIFILHCTGEERGLLGSKWFVDHPTVPLATIVCDLNIDMVGRNKSKEMDVYGNGTSPDLDAAHNRAAAKSGLTFFPRTGSIFMRSDQVNFYERDIPCLFWTSGLHKDYHTPDDQASRIDEAKVARAAVHAFCTAWEIANRTERPAFRKLDANASSGPLGAVLDVVPAAEIPQAKLAPGEGAALVRSVLDGTPAAEAKLQQGDIIIGVGDAGLSDSDPVSSVEDAMKAAKGGKATLRVIRGTKILRVTVKP